MLQPSATADDPELMRVVRRAARRWPGVKLQPGEFLEHLRSAGALPTEGEPAAAESALDDLYLAAACLRGDPAALGHLDREFLRPVGAFVASIDAGPAFADEVRQQVRYRLLGGAGQPPALARFLGSGTLGGWVRVAALRIALNLRRSARRAESTERRGAPLDPLAEALDLELASLKERYREHLTRALETALHGLSDRERTLLRLYHAEELPLEQIGGLYRVHLSTVSRWLTRARQGVAERTLQILRDRLEIGATEADSIARLVHSQVDVSLLRLLRSRT
jgi:RNA polymerase sigma-70 factor (ECF subfamily)